jgi:hypothetical protein
MIVLFIIPLVLAYFIIRQVFFKDTWEVKIKSKKKRKKGGKIK